MKVYYTDKRPNGQPIEPGTLALVTDLEDGTNPVWTYAKDRDEMERKLALQNANAQLKLARLAAATTQPVATIPSKRVIGADAVMQATADLTNPAKAGAAVATLLESATGINPEDEAREKFARLSEEWEDEHPEFYQHEGNRTLVGALAGERTGRKLGLITKELLTQCYNELLAAGRIFERPETQSNLTTFPGENQAQRTERPRGSRFATGTRSTSFSAPQTVQTRGLKYTEEQIRTMPTSKARDLIESGDKDYAAACEYYYSEAQATA